MALSFPLSRWPAHVALLVVGIGRLLYAHADCWLLRRSRRSRRAIWPPSGSTSSTSSKRIQTCRFRCASGGKHCLRTTRRRPDAAVARRRSHAEFIARLRAADEDGLDPAAYPADRFAALMESATPRSERIHRRAAFLGCLPRIRLRYPCRTLPAPQGRSELLRSGAHNRSAHGTQSACASPSVEEFFAPGNRRHRNTPPLRQTLADYRALAAAGGWPSVPLGESLKPGMSDERVPALRARLAVTDDAAPAAAGAERLYDDALVAGRRGLPVPPRA